MNKHILYTIALLFSLQQISITQSWQQIYPSWQVNGIYTMYHWAGDTMYAGGWNSTLLRSVDGGMNWEPIPLTGLSFSKNCSYINITDMDALGQDLYFTAIPSPPPNRHLLENFGDEQSKCLFYRLNTVTGEISDLSVNRPVFTFNEENYPIVQCTNQTVYLIGDRITGSIIYKMDAGDVDWQTDTIPGIVMRFLALSDSIHLRVKHATYLERETIIERSTDGGSTWSAYIDTLYPTGAWSYEICEGTTIEGSNIIFLGIAEGVIYSADTGKTWNKTGDIPWKSIDNRHCSGIAYSGDGALYVVGWESDVYITRDFGASWQELKAPDLLQKFESTTASAICIPANGNIVISNKEGHFYRSSNGGLTWDEQFLAELRSIRKIHFFDLDRGIALAISKRNEEKIYFTTDAGETWLFTGSDDGFYYLKIIWNISSFDSLFKYDIDKTVYPQRFSLTVSTDQGFSWIPFSQGEIPAFQSGWNLEARDDIFTLSGRSYDTVWISKNRGIDWMASALPPEYKPRNAPGGKLMLTQSQADLSLFIFPSDFDLSKQIFISRDTGRTWTHYYTVPDADGTFLTEVDPISADSVYIKVYASESGNTSAKYYSTTNGGVSWNFLESATDDNVTGETIYLLPDIFIFIESQGNVRVRHRNVTWDSAHTQFHRHITYHASLSILDANHIWLAAGQSIFRTTNGGVNWVQQPFTVQENAAITSIYPNPVMAGQHTTIDIVVGTQPFEAQGSRAVSAVDNGAGADNTGVRRTPLHIAIYDLLGRAVTTLYNGPADPGTRTLTWQPAPTLPAGMYVVRMAHGEKVWAKQVAVVR